MIMSANFPAIFLMLTLFTGFAWVFEIFYLAPRRQANAVGAAHAPGQPLWVEYTAGLFPVLAVIFVLRSFLFEPFTIPSSSMLPTLLIGDYILVNKYTYGIRLPVIDKKIVAVNTPKRGEVMVFKHPNDATEYLIKRVVGVPGDRIVYSDKRLSINGQALTYEVKPDYTDRESLSVLRQYTENLNGAQHAVLEDERAPTHRPGQGDFPGSEHCSFRHDGFSCTVPAGQYFMMGDNRDNSSDSRYWGFVPDQNITGRAILIWMNFKQLGHLGWIH
jgi:signal peptidase I